MKLILRDHFRRWWWVWLAGIIGVAAIAWGISLGGEHNKSFGGFPFGIFMGAFLLSFDLQRGHARAVLAMPVTAKQIARGWWWAAVGIPAAAITVVTLLVFTIVSVCSGDWSSLADCVIYCVANLLILGVMFFGLTGMPAQRSGGNWRDQIRGILFGGLWGASIGGWMFFSQLNLYSTIGVVFFLITAILTILGWFRAETLVRERAGFRIAFQSFSAKSAKASHCAEGHGGLPFLFQTIFTRMVVVGLAMTGLFVLIFGLMIAPKFAAIAAQTHGAAQVNPWKGNFPIFIIFQFLWVVGFQIIPVCLHLRFLRTLPVSTTRLAAVFVFTPPAAMLVILYFMGLLVAGAFHQPLSSAVELLRQGGVLQIALASVFVPVVVWRGWSVVTYLVFFTVMMACIFGSIFANAKFSSLNSVAISLLLISISFIATKFILESSSYAYRPRASQIGGVGWGAGR
jgi:hypothetical protein